MLPSVFRQASYLDKVEMIATVKALRFMEAYELEQIETENRRKSKHSPME